ncbi:glutamate-1-semialdehyde 2,1-aminomutase [Deferribacterales bacterium RsTz2092]|nr:glutamate-1-semialdehyde 2,1-aminomutase [Deferribacterales bacterium]
MTIFERAKLVIPGGVNSPVRAFGSVGGEPYFVERADGAYIYADGKRYIDYVSSWGPMILGHNEPSINAALKAAVDRGVSYGAPTLLEVELAELTCEMLPSVDMVRMVSSGTEAVMSAIRVARGFTGRNLIVKFEGCYHGHSDSLLVKGGSGMLTLAQPSSLGVPADITKNTLVADYNDIASVEALFNKYSGQIACLIVEPVAANMGVVLPKEGFLQALRDLTTREGALLIFDEVITGFRLSAGGAQEYYNVMPDLTTLGKIIGGGLPVGAYGGRRDIMELVSPSGAVYQAGTLSGNPLAMTAGLATLKKLQEPNFYEKLNKKATILWAGFADNLKKLGKNYAFNAVGSLACLFFTDKRVDSFKSAMTSDTKLYAKYFHGMLERGIALAPAQFEAMFACAALSDTALDTTIKAHYEVVRGL